MMKEKSARVCFCFFAAAAAAASFEPRVRSQEPSSSTHFFGVVLRCISINIVDVVVSIFSHSLTHTLPPSSSSSSHFLSFHFSPVLLQLPLLLETAAVLFFSRCFSKDFLFRNSKHCFSFFLNCLAVQCLCLRARVQR